MPRSATHEDFDPAVELPALARLAIETFVRTGEKIDVPREGLAAPACPRRLFRFDQDSHRRSARLYRHNRTVKTKPG